MRSRQAYFRQKRDDAMNWTEKAAKIGEQASEAPQVKSGDVPDMELYMDQLVNFLDQRLGAIKREPDMPFITNTMINNYTKTRLIPPAVHKRYLKKHVLGLSMVGQLKKVLSMQDLGRVSSSVQNGEFEGGLYEVFLDAQREAFQSSRQLIAEAQERCVKYGLEGNEALAAMAVELSAQAQCRTLLAERLLDAMEPGKTEEGRKKAKA